MESMNCCEFSRFDVHFKDLGGFAKEHFLWFSPNFEVSKEVFHTHTLKERYFLNNNPIFLLKLNLTFIIFTAFKQEQLVLSLIIHD
jgi:hypothetical protein